jgi:hypothetical protein
MLGARSVLQMQRLPLQVTRFQGTCPRCHEVVANLAMIAGMMWRATSGGTLCLRWGSIWQYSCTKLRNCDAAQMLVT